MDSRVMDTPAIDPPSQRSWWMLGMCGDATERDRRNLQRYTRWAQGWALSFVAASFVLVKGLVPMGPPAWIVAALPLLASFYTLRAYLKYLREADELQRRVQLEALGLGFGAGVLFMMGYRLFERIGAPKLDMIAALFVMLLTWAFAQAWIARRYR